MTDLDRLHALAQACVQAAHEAEDTQTAVMLLDSAHQFLDRIARSTADEQEFNREQIYRGLLH
jgi:hypothetical protein